MSRAAEGRVLLVLVLAVGVFQAAALRDGFNWFHDSVGYVTHAENLAAGRGYAESGYLPNPYRYIAPKAYPPGYPLLLAPAVKAFGSDTRILRWVNVAVLVAVLLATARIARERLPFAWVAVLVGAVGLQPSFRENLQRLLSDIPFLLFVVLALGAYGAAAGAETRRSRLLLGALAGALAGYAILTRSLGAVLVPAVLLHELIRFRFRRLSAAGVSFLGTTAILAAAWSVTPLARSMEEAATTTHLPPNPYLALKTPPGETVPTAAPPDSANAFEYRHSHLRLALSNVLRGRERIPQRTARNAVQYAKWGADLWDSGRSPLAGRVLLAAVLALAAAGLLRHAGRERRAYDVFVVLYFLALLPWSFAERRYLFPLVPFLAIHALSGARLVAERARAGARWPVVAIALVIGAVYASKYSTMRWDPIDDVYSGPDAEALFELLETTTAPDDTYLSEYPRQLAYFTGHRVTAPQPELDERCWWPHARWLDAAVVVVGPLEWPGVRSLAEFVEPPAEAGAPGGPRPGFEKVFDRAEFRVYRLHPPDGS